MPLPFRAKERPTYKSRTVHYLTAPQKNGKDLCAAEVFKEIYSWLKGRGCEKLVSRQLIEQYAMSVSRWVQCEEAISAYGFLAKHPTTGNAIASPYVSMSQQFMKQSNQIWYGVLCPFVGQVEPCLHQIHP